MKNLFIILSIVILGFSSVEIVPAQVEKSNNSNNNEELTNSVKFAKLDRIKSIVEYVESIQDSKISSFALGEIADLVWKKDEGFSKALFTRSLNKLVIKESDSKKEILKKNRTYRKIVSLIAKNDLKWAKNLIREFNKEAKSRAKTNLEIAENLLETDSSLASEFAKQSIDIEITNGLLWFLKKLKERKPNEADLLFQQILARYPQQNNIDAKQFAILGTYLFTSPNLDPSDYQTISLTRVGNIIFPNITANLPNISADLVNLYIKSAVLVINRPSANNQQNQFKYALGYLLIPKARQFAPNLIGELSGAMASLSSIPAEFAKDESFSNIKKKVSGSLAERIEEIDKISDAYTRNRLFLDVVYQAWKKEDYSIARVASDKIEDEKIQYELKNLILFGEGKSLLSKKNANLLEITQIAYKLPHSLEKSLLWTGIAKVAKETNQDLFIFDAFNSAEKSSSKLSDKNTPFLLTFISAEIIESDSITSNSILLDAIRHFNKFDDVKEPLLTHKVKLEPLVLPFDISIKQVNLDFKKSFKKIVSLNDENSIEIINDINDEELKAKSFVALVEALIVKESAEKKQSLINTQEKVIRVGEDGIRKSAKNKVMPKYPRQSISKRAKGVAVAEIQYNGRGIVTSVKVLQSPDSLTGKAVSTALKKWTFTPSKQGGKPVSISGKITFYFVIDSKGKGKVKNPKQFK